MASTQTRSQRTTTTHDGISNINNAHNSNNNKPTYTVAHLLTKITTLIETCDFELAYTFCLRALAMESDNVAVLEATGAVELELEKFEEAREHFSKAISLSPSRGSSKYMYMGQLSENLDSINYFQTGIDLMTEELKSVSAASTSEEQEHHQALCRKISTALCSMTEIYLTDCCFESDAESRCESYLNRAIEIDKSNPEVYQVLASVRLSQQRKEDAKLALENSINLWINAEPGMYSNAIMPTYAARISLVKLLLELSQYNRALTVLDGLQKEDDEMIELWYLYGWSYYCMGEDASNDEEKSSNWEDARDCLNTCKKLFNKFESDDDGICQHTQELLQTINAFLKPSTSASEDECSSFGARERYVAPYYYPFD
ncbi:6370_t:CDS:2 [Ambispora gerdemannii]|uniref:6370_t:CDS:1 n=1 Tax=Ambispora gerdemannii TaxID=144530 RepID=A0A9N8YP17_9GLOM|nr:6370_t:CDS:2 [Ambispora gerdemannii]